jgi:succinate dehydrogenase/fumarate reductase flavoprotein subunit
MPEEQYDVVVLGTGAAGLTAALAAAHAGARVALFEKAQQVGGTTALSSAVVWLPDNRYAREAGVTDSRQEGLDYLSSLSHGLILPELAEAFVDTGAEVIDWLESSTPVHFQLVHGFPDYHPEHPGGKPTGGRSIEPVLFSYDTVPGWSDRVAGTPRRMNVSDTPTGGGTGVIDPDELARREAASIEGLGRALVGSLLAGCLEQGVEPVTSTRATRLEMTDGRVTGVELEGPDGTRSVTARSVVIATGGFEYDADLVRDFLRGPMRAPAGVPTNTGDGLRMAMRVGAQLGNMREAWWVPVIELPGERADGGNNVFLILRERTLPGSIMVNDQGRRFTNEAANYNALGGAFHAFDPTAFRYVNQPCWLVFDEAFVQRYGCFGNAAGAPVPDFITRAGSVTELAGLIGVPPHELDETVQRWNKLAESGHDDDFNRGDSAYDGWCGDRTAYPGPMATLGPLETAPYYAVELIGSTLGTKGGPRTDVDGNVLDVDGDPIGGLYAAGNAMAGPTGMVYGGAGGTLGPAMVFGFRAGRAAAHQTTRVG